MEQKIASICSQAGLSASGPLSRTRFLKAWKELGRAGLMGLVFPKKYGGSQWNLRRVIPILESLGGFSEFSGIPFSLGAQIWSVQSPLLKFGTEEQKSKFLKPLCLGSMIGAGAMTEETGGSDVLGIRTLAWTKGGRYFIQGKKVFISNAPLADLFIVWARLKDRRGPMSLSSFLVPRRTPGLKIISRPRQDSNILIGEISLNRCPVPASLRLGEEGQGLITFLYAMNMERKFLLVPALGAMEKRLRQTLKYVSARKQFGASLADFQAVSHKIADMKIRLEACRALIFKNAFSRDLEGEMPSIIKTFLSESWLANCLDAMATYGAKGCLEEKSLRLELQSALASRAASGTNEIQRNNIFSALKGGGFLT